MKTKSMLRILGISYFVLFFLLGIISDTVYELEDKVPLVFFSFLFLLCGFWYLILSKKENE
jgi:hypothetical protein